MKFEELKKMLDVNEHHKNMFSKDQEGLKDFNYKQSRNKVFEELGIEQYG